MIDGLDADDSGLERGVVLVGVVEELKLCRRGADYEHPARRLLERFSRAAGEELVCVRRMTMLGGRPPSRGDERDDSGKRTVCSLRVSASTWKMRASSWSIHTVT